MQENWTFRGQEEIILERTRRELLEEDSVALGKGLPQRLRDALSRAAVVHSLPEAGPLPPSIGAIVVEADEVSAAGDIVVPGYGNLEPLNGTRLIVATPHNHANGDPKLVQECRSPVTCRNCVEKIITELGVIEIAEAGLVLAEVSPQIATDEVKVRTGASLHIADDIRVMELWD